MLCTAINRQGIVFIWPIRMPGEDGRIDSWNECALEAANLARDSWLRVVANMGLGAYDLFKASGDLPAPEWPTESFQTLMYIAFKGRKIESPDHAVIKRLQAMS